MFVFRPQNYQIQFLELNSHFLITVEHLNISPLLRDLLLKVKLAVNENKSPIYWNPSSFHSCRHCNDIGNFWNFILFYLKISRAQKKVFLLSIIVSGFFLLQKTRKLLIFRLTSNNYFGKWAIPCTFHPSNISVRSVTFDGFQMFFLRCLSCQKKLSEGAWCVQMG